MDDREVAVASGELLGLLGLEDLPEPLSTGERGQASELLADPRVAGRHPRADRLELAAHRHGLTAGLRAVAVGLQ